MLDKWDWFKIFCTSSIYSVPVQKKLYQRKKLNYNIATIPFTIAQGICKSPDGKVLLSMAAKANYKKCNASYQRFTIS